MSDFFENKIVPILRKTIETYMCPDEVSEDLYEFEAYCDYNDDMSVGTAAKILSSENPRETFIDVMAEWAENVNAWNGVSFKDILSHLTAEERKEFALYQEEAYDQEDSMDLEEDVQTWLNDHIRFYMPQKRYLDQVFDVNFMIATEKEANQDMASYTVWNDYEDHSGEIDEDCALIWMCDQMGRKESVLKAIRSAEENAVYEDEFVKSVIEELENFSHCMGGITFLIKMSLDELIELKEMQKQEKGSVRIKKEADCGIYNPWVGGGSCLEILLPEDIEIPVSMIWDAWIDGSKKHGYDVGDVYGLCSSAWKPDTVVLKNDTEK